MYEIRVKRTGLVFSNEDAGVIAEFIRRDLFGISVGENSYWTRILVLLGVPATKESLLKLGKNGFENSVFVLKEIKN